MNDSLNNTEKLIVGDIYEIDSWIKLSINGNPPKGPIFAKLIGYSSKNKPVFEEDGKFFAVDMADITPIKNAFIP